MPELDWLGADRAGLVVGDRKALGLVGRSCASVSSADVQAETDVTLLSLASLFLPPLGVDVVLVVCCIEGPDVRLVLKM